MAGALPIDDGKVSQWRRSRRLRSHLDALAANVELAEECLQVGEASEAQTLAEGPIGDLVLYVRENLNKDQKSNRRLRPISRRSAPPSVA